MLIVAQIDEIVVRLPLTYSLHIPLDLFGEARQSQYNSPYCASISVASTTLIQKTTRDSHNRDDNANS